MYYIILCYITFDISYFIENCANRAPKSTHYEPNCGSKIVPKWTSKRLQKEPFKRTTAEKAKTM